MCLSKNHSNQKHHACAMHLCCQYTHHNPTFVPLFHCALGLFRYLSYGLTGARLDLLGHLLDEDEPAVLSPGCHPSPGGLSAPDSLVPLPSTVSPPLSVSSKSLTCSPSVPTSNIGVPIPSSSLTTSSSASCAPTT